MPMSLPTSDKPMSAETHPIDRVPAENSDNPIVNASPIVNTGSTDHVSPVISDNPIIQASEEAFAPEQEYMSAGCTAVVPPGARKIYMIMVIVTMLVGAGIVSGLFWLFDRFGMM